MSLPILYISLSLLLLTDITLLLTKKVSPFKLFVSTDSTDKSRIIISLIFLVIHLSAFIISFHHLGWISLSPTFKTVSHWIFGILFMLESLAHILSNNPKKRLITPLSLLASLQFIWLLETI